MSYFLLFIGVFMIWSAVIKIINVVINKTSAKLLEFHLGVILIILAVYLNHWPTAY